MKNISGFRNLSFDIDNYLVRFVPPSQLYRLPQWISRFLGYRSSPCRDVGNVLVWFWSFIGAFGAIALIAGVFKASEQIQHFGPPVLFASLGAAAILEFNAIASPLAQPRNALFGQVISAVIGISVTKLFRYSDNYEDVRWLAGAVATGAASFAMGATNSVYPPGGATALMAAVDGKVEVLGWMLVPLIVLGTVLMILWALIINNIQRRFPLYWFTAREVGRPKRSWTGTTMPSKEEEQILEQFREYSDSMIDAQNIVVIKNEPITLPESLGIDPEEVRMLIVIKRRIDDDDSKKQTSASSDVA